MEHATFQHMPCYYPTKLNKICDNTPASPMFFYKVMAFVAISGVYPASVCVIVSRSVSDRVAYGVQSDCVRRPIGLRSVSDRIPFG